MSDYDAYKLISNIRNWETLIHINNRLQLSEKVSCELNIVRTSIAGIIKYCTKPLLDEFLCIQKDIWLMALSSTSIETKTEILNQRIEQHRQSMVGNNQLM